MTKCSLKNKDTILICFVYLHSSYINACQEAEQKAKWQGVCGQLRTEYDMIKQLQQTILSFREFHLPAAPVSTSTSSSKSQSAGSRTTSRSHGGRPQSPPPSNAVLGSPERTSRSGKSLSTSSSSTVNISDSGNSKMRGAPRVGSKPSVHRGYKKVLASSKGATPKDKENSRSSSNRGGSSEPGDDVKAALDAVNDLGSGTPGEDEENNEGEDEPAIPRDPFEGFDKELVNMIRNDVLDATPNVHWEDVAGK